MTETREHVSDAEYFRVDNLMQLLIDLPWLACQANCRKELERTARMDQATDLSVPTM